MKTINEVAAANVRAMADDNDVTLDDLGLQAGMAVRTFARRMTGQSDWTLNELDRVSQILGADIGDLVSEQHMRVPQHVA